jgi:hypothetical protein
MMKFMVLGPGMYWAAHESDGHRVEAHQREVQEVCHRDISTTVAQKHHVAAIPKGWQVTNGDKYSSARVRGVSCMSTACRKACDVALCSMFCLDKLLLDRVQ